MQQQTFVHNNTPQSGPRTARQIEDLLDADRRDLTASLTALRDRLSVDALWAGGVSLAKANVQPYTKAVDAAVRANPAAVALTGIGLAWLILGRRGRPEAGPAIRPGSLHEAVQRWEDEGGPVAETTEPREERWGEDEMNDDWVNEDWVNEADRLRSRAGDLLARINAAARDRLAPAADLARHRAEVVAALTQDLRHVMGRGLGRLTGSAREGAMVARERAYELRVRASTAGAQTIRANPVLAGTALAAGGAILAALLPGSAFERRVFGAPRDRVLAEVQQFLRGERQRIAASFNQMASRLETEAAERSAPTEMERERG